MTDEEILSIAEDAQAQITAGYHFGAADAADLLRFARLIAAAERESCAMACEERRMIVCPQCGNKRCPRAADIQRDCTDSNEPGQH